MLQRTMQLWMFLHLFAVGLLLRFHCTEQSKLPKYNRSDGHLLYEI